MKKLSGSVKKDGYEVWIDSEASEKVSGKYSKATDSSKLQFEFKAEFEFVSNKTVSESEGSKSSKPSSVKKNRN